MKTRVMMLLLSSLGACAFVAKTVGYERKGNFAMPDLTGQSVGDAKDSLAKAGMRGSVSTVDNYVCDDPKVKVDQVCFTSPRAGHQTSSRIPVTLYLRPHEAKTFAMPDLGGLTADQATKKLRDAGQDPQRIYIEPLRGDPPEGCKEHRVCRQSPEAGRETRVDTPKSVYLGPEGAGKKPKAKPRRDDRDDDDGRDRERDEGRDGEERDGEERDEEKKPDEPQPIF